MRRLIAAILTIASVAAPSARLEAQTAPAARPAGGELIPFWLVIPEYPGIAQAARVQGVVIVTMTVGAEGRVESTTIERDVPLLARSIIEAAKDSGFICRGCTGPMAYRITYDFRLVDSVEQVQDARGVVTSTSATLSVVAMAPVVDTTVYGAAGPRPMSGRPLEHAEQEP